MRFATSKEPRMKSVILWALVALNTVLLFSLVSRVSGGNAAIAQQNAARRGDYLMIPGDVTGTSSGIVYVLDQTNGWLSAMSLDDSRGQVSVMPRIDLQTVMNGQQPNPNDHNNRRPR